MSMVTQGYYLIKYIITVFVGMRWRDVYTKVMD